MRAISQAEGYETYRQRKKRALPGAQKQNGVGISAKILCALHTGGVQLEENWRFREAHLSATGIFYSPQRSLVLGSTTATAVYMRGSEPFSASAIGDTVH